MEEDINKENIKNNIMNMVFEKKSEKTSKSEKIPEEKLEKLKKCFDESPYPTNNKYTQLSSDLDINRIKIVNWFKFQRKNYLKTNPIKSYKKRRVLKQKEKDFLEEKFRKNSTPLPEDFYNII